MTASHGSQCGLSIGRLRYKYWGWFYDWFKVVFGQSGAHSVASPADERFDMSGFGTCEGITND